MVRQCQTTPSEGEIHDFAQKMEQMDKILGSGRTMEAASSDKWYLVLLRFMRERNKFQNAWSMTEIWKDCPRMGLG